MTNSEFKDKINKISNTRRKERIRPFLSILQKYWESNPDLRFIQMLWSLGMITPENDWFNKEEKDLYKDSKIPVRDWLMLPIRMQNKPVASYVILKHMKNADIVSFIDKHNNWEKIDEFVYKELSNELLLREELKLYI